MLKILTLLGISALLLAACSSAAGAPIATSQQTAQQVESSLLEDAAKQATEIVAQAQATALVMQAESQAAALVAEADASLQIATPAPASATVEQIGLIPTPNNAQQTLFSPSEQTVEIVQVTLALDGGIINIQFHAPPEVADKWWQGSIKVIDELTGKEYTEIPVMPKLGPLISKPRVYGQVGNVMLVNAPPGVRAGDLVTVILGSYTFEHIQVK